MLIEQIIAFELRGPGSPGCTSTPTIGYFYDKTNISNLQVDYYLMPKYCRSQSPYLGQITHKF